MKRTLIVGASPNPDRYAYLAAHRLVERGHDILPIGIKRGEVAGEQIIDLRKRPDLQDIDTITLYINPSHQKEWQDYLLSLHPKRIIFNPGTENPTLIGAANELGIETEIACTLVMLSAGTY
ncbi:MAG: CoA-binding protein [Bacteroidota bacterium]